MYFLDAKKSVWVPDGEGGFDEAMIDTVDGDKVNVKVGWEPKTFKSAQVMQVNPPKMEKFDDVSNMTYLNEAAVLWNLKARYVSKLIYTYSGKKLIKMQNSLDAHVFRTLLRCHQPVQAVPDLHGEDVPDVHQQEEERGESLRFFYRT